MFSYHTLTDPKEMAAVVELEILVWGLDPVDAVPINILASNIHNGGVIHVAKLDGQLVGFSVGFLARRNTNLMLWSHMMGVHPDYQGNGIGYELKQHQKQWAKEQKLSGIGWTFDPLQTANANFNLNRLGAVIVKYHPDFYGPMQDAINHHPLPSDRVEAYLPIEKHAALNVAETDVKPILDVSGKENLEYIGAEHIGIAVRKNHKTVDWQQKIRHTFQIALEQNYLAHQFMRSGDYGYYILSRLQL